MTRRLLNLLTVLVAAALTPAQLGERHVPPLEPSPQFPRPRTAVNLLDFREVLLDLRPIPTGAGLVARPVRLYRLLCMKHILCSVVTPDSWVLMKASPTPQRKQASARAAKAGSASRNVEPTPTVDSRIEEFRPCEAIVSEPAMSSGDRVRFT
jgi:hypothetical protein